MKIHITIEPGKFTGAMIEWAGKHRRTSAAFMLLISFVALWAAPITKPYTFSNGGIVSASEMNANFDALYTKVNELDAKDFRFPDGTNATPVVVTTSSYTVPAGKTLYVTATSSNINRGANVICAGTHYGCMIEAGASLTGANFSGFVVDTATAPINNSSGSYTVPAGKTLVLLSNSVWIQVSSNNVIPPQAGFSGFFPAGTTLTWSNGWITGYLR